MNYNVCISINIFFYKLIKWLQMVLHLFRSILYLVTNLNLLDNLIFILMWFRFILYKMFFFILLWFLKFLIYNNIKRLLSGWIFLWFRNCIFLFFIFFHLIYFNLKIFIINFYTIFLYFHFLIKYGIKNRYMA